MSVPQRINDFITSKRPDAVCNKCIADGLGLTNTGAHPAQVTGALATTSDFKQESGQCSICKADKKIIRRAQSPRGEKRPADTIGRAVMIDKIATGEIEERED